MKRLLQILTILTLLTSCSHNVDQDTIDNLAEFKKAKNVLIDNLEFIKQSVDYQDYDSLKRVRYSTIMNANRYYFENSVSKENPELTSLLSLWDNGLIYQHKVFGTIFLNNDSVVTFTTDFEDGIFSGIGHYVIYNPTNDNNLFEKNGHRILKEQNLDDNWFYLIQRRNFVD